MRASAGGIQEGVDRLFDRLERLRDTELVMLRAVWEAGDSVERQSAWRNAMSFVRERRLEALLADARARLAAWVNNDPMIGIVGKGAYPTNPSGLDYASVRQAALPPMLDAIMATIAAESLTPEGAAVLLEPLDNVVSSRAVP